MDLNNSNTPEAIQTRRHTVAAPLLIGVVSGVIGAGIALYAAPLVSKKFHIPDALNTATHSQSDNTHEEIIQSVVAEDAAITATVEKSSPAVVSVVISQDVPKLQNMGNPFGFPFFLMPQDSQDSLPGSGGNGGVKKQTVGQGSGFLVSSDGLIVTNKHVISIDSAEYTVIMSDGKEYKAQILAKDPNRDIALLKIDAHDAPYLTLGDSDSIRVGQSAVAIGNSLGEFSNTVSKGIISGLKRNLVAGSERGESERLSGIIQTDAAINPGNSGGPLLDISGNVIGVNVAMAQGAQSIGFALPSNQIKKIIDQVQTTGKISTAFLGIRYVVLSPELQKENSLPLDSGALILRGDRMTDFAVVPGSPADKAGLMENDIILEVDGEKITNEQQISDIVADKKPGDALDLTVWHKGETKTIKVVLDEKK